MQAGMRRQRGFTLIELLLSIVIITALAGLSLPVMRATQTTNDLALATYSFAQSARRAQAKSRLASQDDQWGVIAQSGEVVVFKGASYAARDAEYDEVSSISPTLTIAGTGEYSFSKVSGQPRTTGSVTFTNATDDADTVTITSSGVAVY